MQAQSLKISSVKFFSKISVFGAENQAFGTIFAEREREREREDTPNTQRISCA